MLHCKYKPLLVFCAVLFCHTSWGRFFVSQIDPRIGLLASLFLFDANEVKKLGVKNAAFLAQQLRFMLAELGKLEQSTIDHSKIFQSLISEGHLIVDKKDFSAILQQAFVDYSLFWKKNYKSVEWGNENIPKAHKRCNIDSLLPQIKVFFDSELLLDDSEPFEVFLFPVIQKHYGFSLEPKYIFVQPVPYDGVANLGVVIHEVCHLFYKAMNPSRKKMIETFFKNHRSPYAQLVMGYLDEALATGIGNRFVVSQASTPPKRGAYDNPYIDKFSEVLLDLIVDYLQNNRKMDNAFLEESIRFFESTFPNSLENYAAILFTTTIFSDRSEQELLDLGLLEKFKNIFDCGEVQFASVLEKEKGWNQAQKLSGRIFLLKNSTSIKGITLPGQSDTLYVQKDKQGVLIVIQTDDFSKAEKALLFLKKQEQFRASFLYNL
jgi:hypothetical protein